MAMRHRILPRTLHAEQPSTKVDWTQGDIRLLTDNRPWTDPGRPRRAAVSSFGASGTNAHTILEEAPPKQPKPGSRNRVRRRCWCPGWSPAAPNAPCATRPPASPPPSASWTRWTWRTPWPPPAPPTPTGPSSSAPAATRCWPP
ncbi:ketoacyl-synthetase C-terminal extension domain-containing protein [Streptomyces nogalater]